MELKQLVDVAYAEYGDMDLINMALADKRVWLKVDDLFYLSTVERGLTEMEQNEGNFGTYVDLRLGERTVTFNYQEECIVIQRSQEAAFYSNCREEQRMRDYIDARTFAFTYDGPYLVAHMNSGFVVMLLNDPNTDGPLIKTEDFQLMKNYLEKFRIFHEKNAFYQMFCTENDMYEEYCARPFGELRQMKQQMVDCFLHSDFQDHVSHFTLFTGFLDSESSSPLINSGTGSFIVVRAKDNEILFDSRSRIEEMDTKEPE